MKKIISFALAIMILFSFACAEFDLASLSYEELISLRSAVESEIISRPEWKEVTVPSGRWYVGSDIPAGSYSVFPSSYGGYLRVKDQSGRIVANGGIRTMDQAFGKLELLDGYIVEVENGSLIFAPAKGLGF